MAAKQAPAGMPRGEHWSITQFAEETGRTRETVSKRIGASRIVPFGVGNRAKYRVREVLPLLFSADSEGNMDPSKLEPSQRLAHFRAEQAEQQLAVSSRQLIPAAEVEQDRAELFKLIAQTFDNIPDILERDCGLTPAQVQRVEDVCDEVRTSLADRIDGPAEEETS